MPKLIFTPDERGELKVELEGFTGQGCLKVAEAFVSKMGASVGMPELEPEYFFAETDTNFQQEVN